MNLKRGTTRKGPPGGLFVLRFDKSRHGLKQHLGPVADRPLLVQFFQHGFITRELLGRHFNGQPDRNHSGGNIPGFPGRHQLPLTGVGFGLLPGANPRVGYLALQLPAGTSFRFRDPVPGGFRRGDFHDFASLRISELAVGHRFPHLGQLFQLPGQLDEIARSCFGEFQFGAGVLVDG